MTTGLRAAARIGNSAAGHGAGGANGSASIVTSTNVMVAPYNNNGLENVMPRGTPSAYPLPPLPREAA